MWIFLNDAFLSIVAHRDRPELLLVRARFAGDIERVFPAYAERVRRTPHNDYLFRVEVPREEVADAMALAALSIDAPNFKASVPDRWRHDLYMQVWTAMEAEQRLHLGRAWVDRPAGLGWPGTIGED